jgi:ATP-binding cassette subfamily G (WHITE) protein 2 (PDR)
MYRVSPFTYLIEGMLSTGVSGTEVVCAKNEYLTFDPPPGQNCSAYMAPYMSQRGGYLQNPGAGSDCSFCALRETNAFLKAFAMDPANAWRDFGLMWVYTAFNVFGALFFYWLFRVPKRSGRKVKEEQTPATAEKSASGHGG